MGRREVLGIFLALFLVAVLLFSSVVPALRGLTPTQATVDYVTCAPGQGANGQVAYTYTIAAPARAHLLLTVEPNQATYMRSQPLTLDVTVLNQKNPALESTLTLTVTGPGSYSYFDFETINVAADALGEYTFAWNIPAAAGTYVVEVGLVPAQLTAYDAAWLKVV